MILSYAKYSCCPQMTKTIFQSFELPSSKDNTYVAVNRSVIVTESAEEIFMKSNILTPNCAYNS